MTVAAYWCISDNFGDKLTPWIVGRIRNESVAWVPPEFDAEHYVVSGSVLNWANEHALVWGAGLASFNDTVNEGAKLYAVRGPLSRAKALAARAKCPAVYGDPALLLPKFHDKPQEKRHLIGYVPHYVDQFRVFERYQGEKIINILDSIEKVIDNIRSCQKIVSSALHGIVVAHAYGIPAAWVRWSDSIGGDSMKYQDYFMSVGLDVPYPMDRRESKDEIDFGAYTVPDPKRLKDMGDALWGACPIRRSGE